jgi:hypothetical protein
MLKLFSQVKMFVAQLSNFQNPLSYLIKKKKKKKKKAFLSVECFVKFFRKLYQIGFGGILKMIKESKTC